LARLARIDPQLLAPVQHRSAQAQVHLMVGRFERLADVLPGLTSPALT